MSNKYITVFLIFVTISWIPTEVFGVQIWGGRIENVLVLEEGTGPGQIKGQQHDSWKIQPNAVDIDIKGNIYLHDLCNGRIQIFSSAGKFLRELKINDVLKDRWADGATEGLDFACDNANNIYLIDLAKTKTWHYLRLVKFFYNEKMVDQLVVVDTFELPGNWIPDTGINADYFGNVYFYLNPADYKQVGKYPYHQEKIARIYLYENGGSLKMRFDVQEDTTSPQIVQKADSLGRVIFLRNGYLHLTNILEIISGVPKDSIKEPEELTSAFTLIGFDLNFNIYILEKNHWVYKASEIAAARTYITIIHRYKIKDSRLTETGRVYLNFSKGLSDEEREKMVTKFVKRYVVAGNGEVYFLHGTIDKLYISKIIFEEFSNKK